MSLGSPVNFPCAIESTDGVVVYYSYVNRVVWHGMK